MKNQRFPRSLEEAFGPYARGPICEPYTPMDREDKIVVAACVAVGIFFVVLVCMGVI